MLVIRSFAFLALVMGAALGTSQRALAEAVYGKRFDPPRVYFRHGNLNKKRLTAIKGQDNFLAVYIPAIDLSEAKYSADRFSIRVHFPRPLTVLDGERMGIQVKHTPGGSSFSADIGADQMAARCLRGNLGIDLTIWYRVDEAEPGLAAKSARVELLYDGKPCFQSRAKVSVLDELPVPPRIDPKDFRFWLHYGPYHRAGEWDALDDYLRKAGINAVQFTLAAPAEQMTNRMKALRQRGYYIIAQRVGSYAKASSSTREIEDLGPDWFVDSDEDCMRHYLPLADAVLWDFEPSPARIWLDDWTLQEFRKAAKLEPGVQLSKETIRGSYFKEWIAFRQRQLAQAVRSWAEFCRAIDPDIETIVTQGHTHRFDPLSQIDFATYGSDVTFCDPMNFVGKTGLEYIRRWMAHAPNAQFTACQNVALSYEPVFVTARATMLQLVGAALIGVKGTSIYPGWTMDGENFALLNRAAMFLGKNREFVFAGIRNPPHAQLELLPKETREVALGDGRLVKVSYPDWSKDGIRGVYQLTDSPELLAVIENLNETEPCFAKLRLDLASGKWAVLDDEHRTAWASNGSPLFSADQLREGLLVSCPPSDFRGYRIVSAASANIDDYLLREIGTVSDRYQEYSGGLNGASSVGTDNPGTETGRLLLHVDFEQGTRAVAAGGEANAIVQKGLRFEKTPEGNRAVVIGPGASLQYSPSGNLDLNRGKLYIRFKPNWDGTDGRKHELFRIKPVAGLVYLAKLNDGRLLLNMFDAGGKQHYPSYLIRDMVAREWQSLLVTWDSSSGLMSMFLNGEKVAEKRMPPWRMAPVANRARDGRITFPASADAAIDEIKIWDQP